MVRIAIVGLGMMGRTHYEAYQKLPNAQVVAIADIDPARAAGNLAGTAGNVLSGGLPRLPMDRIKGTSDYRELLAMKDVDLIDVCVPTPVHPEIAVAALRAGKHVMCEKPLARTADLAHDIVTAAGKPMAPFFMPAMCMRFWPQWVWLKEAVADNRYGKVLSATFQRLSSMPQRPWYSDGAQSGGAVLDLHVHDVDFVYHLFGLPQSVFSRGYTRASGRIDHIATQYIYPNGPSVFAEGGWSLADGFGFRMRYTVNFETATADFDIGRKDQLILSRDGKSEPIACADESGYDGEMRYIVQCIARNERPTIVSAADAMAGLTLIEAEVRSVESRAAVRVGEES